MILNHKRSIELLVDDAEEIGFNKYTILNLHGLLSENLLPDPTASGRLRERSVEIGGSVFKPTSVPQLIEESFEIMLDKADPSKTRSSKHSSSWFTFPIFNRSKT